MPETDDMNERIRRAAGRLPKPTPAPNSETEGQQPADMNAAIRRAAGRGPAPAPEATPAATPIRLDPAAVVERARRELADLRPPTLDYPN